MAFLFRSPTHHPWNYYDGVPGGFDLFHDVGREIVFASEQNVGNWAQGQPHRGTVKIASVLLSYFKPEDITLEVDSDKVAVHGKYCSEREDGFDKSEFKRFFVLPKNVDPTTVTSHITQDGSALVIEGLKRVGVKVDDGKFETKLDVSGFKPEDIKIQQHGNVLRVSGKRIMKDGRATRNFSRRVLLPDDVIATSVKSRLSKEGLLTIEASRDPTLLPPKRAVDVVLETDESEDEPKPSTSAEQAETKLD